VKQTYADIQSLVRHLVVQEEKNMVRAKAIPDSAIVPQGGGVFIVKGSEDYYVDLDGPTLYPTCTCIAWETSNPNRHRGADMVLRCKHILKVQTKHVSRRDASLGRTIEQAA
jgi:hypothetical protein